jgi:hypothetical protein
MPPRHSGTLSGHNPVEVTDIVCVLLGPRAPLMHSALHFSMQSFRRSLNKCAAPCVPVGINLQFK